MIDRLLNLDLSGLHLFLTIIGGLTAVYVMQLNCMEADSRHTPWIVKEVHRLSLVIVAGAMFGSALYQLNRGWVPWPPEVALVLGVECMLVSRAVAVWAKMRRISFYHPTLMAKRQAR